MTQEQSLQPLLDRLRETWQVADVQLRSATRLSGGASRLTDALDVVAGGRDVPLVLQRQRPGAVDPGRLRLEHRLLVTARAGGVPVPEVVAGDADGTLLGSPFLLTARLAGETIPRRVLRSPDLAPARERFAADCGRALAAVHALPLATLPELPRADPLQELEAQLDDALGASPAFELGLSWLADHRPRPVPPAVVHGDFRMGNLLLGPQGLCAVLDWELAHAGDPREDLAWLCVRAWRFGGAEPVGGIGTREQLFAAYTAATGAPVDAAAVFWWEVLGTLRWGVMCSLQARVHLEHHTRSVELAVIGRRVVENEYDLLRMLP